MNKIVTAIIILTSIVLALVLLIVLYVFFVFGRPNPPLRTGQATINATSSGAETTSTASGTGSSSSSMAGEHIVIDSATFDIEIASTTIEQARGLSYREGLAENAGMLFLFGSYHSYGFWMKDMHFPLDMIWIKGDTIIGFSENAVPQPGTPLWGLKLYYPSEPVDTVLEVNAGTVKKYGIKAGDMVKFDIP